ncbi:hypothetical protein A4S06_02360 [Erysipelotrichaceae bacterium MTC7]|nr:hypothetical protein A4S06_02360 [Erysipelotrichaceae bacterium MTC7]
MAKEVFGRHECKFIVNQQQKDALLVALKKSIEHDIYNKDGKPYTIYNYYIDDAYNTYLQRSVSKPRYKEKLRIRGYAPFTDTGIVFVEVKKKYKKYGNKRRVQMTFQEAKAFIEKGVLPADISNINQQVLYELKTMIDKQRLHLKVHVQYDRYAFFSTTEKGLRFTFDTNIISHRKHDKTRILLEPGLYVLEIKAEGSFPLWLVKLLQQHQIYKQSFSKIGKEYELYTKELAEKKHANKQMEELYVRNTVQYNYRHNNPITRKSTL